MDRLILNLNGKHFQTVPIKIPLFEDFEMQDRYTAREDYVTSEKTKLRLMYLRAIIKCEFNYSIELFIFSTKI